MIKLKINKRCINQIQYYSVPKGCTKHTRTITAGEQLDIEEKLSEIGMEVYWEED